MKLIPTLVKSAATAGAFLVLGVASQAMAAGFNTANSQIQPSGSANFNSNSNFFASFANIATTVLNVLLLLAGILAVLYLIWSGIQYITSAGNADKAKSARGGIINAVIGIVIIVAAYFIVRTAVSIGNTASSADTTGGGSSSSGGYAP